MNKSSKMVGIISITTLLLTFIGQTQNEYYKKTGTIQFAAFGGWQLAANALYGYAFSKPDKVTDIPGRFRPLHLLVNKHMDSLNQLPIRPDREIGIYYLWDFKSPLRLHMEQSWANDTVTSFFKKWASMAPLYSAYGKYLILHHPEKFTDHYLWPNLQRYYSPPSYFMGIYNMGFETVDSIAIKWFRLNSNTLYTRNENKQIPLADTFSIILPIINLVFVTGFLSFVGLAGFKKCSKHIKQIIWSVILIWVVNTLFSILSAPIEIRYQLFPTIITLIWGNIFLAFIMQNIWITSKKIDNQPTPAVIQIPTL